MAERDTKHTVPYKVCKDGTLSSRNACSKESDKSAGFQLQSQASSERTCTAISVKILYTFFAWILEKFDNNCLSLRTVKVQGATRNLASFCTLQNCKQIRCKLLIYIHRIYVWETYLKDPELGLLLDAYFRFFNGAFSLLCSCFSRHLDRLRQFVCDGLRVLRIKS